MGRIEKYQGRPYLPFGWRTRGTVDKLQ